MSDSNDNSTEEDIVALLARVESVLGGRYVSTVRTFSVPLRIHELEPLNKEAMRVAVFREGGIRVWGSGKMWGFGVPVDEEIFTGTREDRIDKATELILNIGRFGAVTVRPAFIGPRVTRLPHSADDLEAVLHRYRHRIAKIWPAW